MKGSLKILLLSLILLKNILGYSDSIDSLIQNIATVSNDSTRYNLLSQIASAYADSNYSKSLEYYQKALEIAEKTNMRNLVADSYHKIGYCYERMGEFSSALKNFSNSADIYSYLNDKKNLAGVFNDIGLIYRSWGKYDKALENYIKAQKLYDELQDVEGSAIISNSIGQIYFYQENHPKAIEYFIKYFEINTKLGKPRAVAAAANNIASAYLELKKYDNALQYYLKALKIYDSLNVKIGVAIIRDNIGSLFYLKEQYDDALLYHNNALNIFTEINSPLRISSTLKNIGMVYIKQGKLNSAISVLNESLKLAEKSDQKAAIQDIYQILSEAYYSNQNYMQAYDFLKLHNALKDSILNAESIEKIEKLQAEYEAERRENEIASINHQLEIQRKILFAFVGFLAILIGLSLLLIKENIAKKNAIKNIETIKSKILDRLSSTCNSMDIFSHNSSLSEYFSESWEVSTLHDGKPKACMLHFKIDDMVFAYLLIAKDARISKELINLTLYNFVKEFLKKSPGEINILKGAIEKLLSNDPLTYSYDPQQYQIIPIILNGSRVLNIAEESFAIKQQGALLAITDIQWFNLKKGDIVYLYTSVNDQHFLEEKKAIRKIFKNLIHSDFQEQRDIAKNYLQSMEIDESAIIFALKV
ncbi:hypothetical protein CYCD_09910 [Tenuifilaceae bacterium CYCD]|nr:hypothetical protein CYCD_09910 [Tenuifilaceae bacterium CYCD]